MNRQAVATVRHQKGPLPVFSLVPDLHALPTEARNPASEHLDTLSTASMLDVIHQVDLQAWSAVGGQLDRIAAVIDAIAERFARGGRLFYLGAGTSGRLGVLDASECPPTFSVDPGLFVGLIAGGDRALRISSEQSEDRPEDGAHDLEPYALTHADTVLGIAASGRTPYVLGALEAASHSGSLTVALTCAGGAASPSPMARAAQLSVELATGAEVLTGSTRMKAGTATKMVLNMISTGVMVRQGATYGNLMVNVQPTNAKLVDRARRIVAAATGVSAESAAHLLTEAGTVKLAIAMNTLDLPRAEAEAALEAAGGKLVNLKR